MSVSKDEVKYIAQLARLKYTDEELESFTPQFNEILAYIEKLNEIDTESVEPLSHPLGITNALREDELKKSTDNERALKNAPSAMGEFYTVPKVIKQ